MKINHIVSQNITEGLRDPADNPCWKGYHPVGTKKKDGRTVPNCVPVNEGAPDGMVRFVLDSERAYQAVMNRFGDLIDWDENDYMMVPERLWPKVQQVAHDADGIGAENVDDSGDENPEHYSVAEASPDATFNALKGLKSWQVVIRNNYYNGKYADYSGRYYYVLASSPEEAEQVVLDNADAILQDLLTKKSVTGRKILPRSSAVRITSDRIGEIRDGTEHGRMSTTRFRPMFSPRGVMMVKLNNGAIADVQGQEQGIKEGPGFDKWADERAAAQIHKLNIPKTWEVSYDYGPHMTKTVTVKARSEEEARAKVEKAAEKKGLSIMINSVEPKEPGVAEGLEDSNIQSAIIDTVERLFRKNEISDYGALEAIRQGVKHHFSKPGATTESAIEGILNILDKRMSKSGNYSDLVRFKEALRQGVAHQIKKQGVAEYGNTTKGQKMLSKVHHRAADRVTSKKADKDPSYARKAQQTQDRAWDRIKDVAEAEKYPEPEQEIIDATRRARLQREREPQGSDKIDARLAQRNAQLQQYTETGKFWLKKKDTQEHISDAYMGKAQANQAALELLKQHPELKGNIVITAWGPGETQGVAEDRSVVSDGYTVDQEDAGEYDYEGDQAKDQLQTIVAAARKLNGMLDDNENMPEWVQMKITKATDYLDTAADYVAANKAQTEPMAEADQEKIGGRHDPADFDNMVSRLKKLAGAGPLKTVYDPKTRRYKNMPTAVQPGDKK